MFSLVVIFACSYYFFARYPPSKDNGHVGFIFVGGLAAVFFGAFAFFLLRNLAFMRIHNQGVELCQQGRLVEALAKFQEAQAKSKVALPSLNVGMTSLSLWRMPEAVAAFEDFDSRSKRLSGQTPGVRNTGLAGLALAHALGGNKAGVRIALAELTTNGYTSAVTALADLVLACRCDEWERAQHLLSTHAVLLDQLGGGFRALADALTAWVGSKTGHAGGAVSSLRLFRETTPDSLKQAWPEFIDFVERVEAGPPMERHPLGT